MGELAKIGGLSRIDDCIDTEGTDVTSKLTYDQVLQKLLVMETVGLAKDVEKPVVQVWLSLLRSEGVTAQEWGFAVSQVCKTKTYVVKPVEVMDVIKEVRESNRILRHREYMASLVEVKVDGVPTLAPYYRIQDGRILPEGQQNPAALPPWMEVKALDAPAATETDRADKVREIIERSGPEPARILINLLRSQGVNVDAEVAVYQEEKEKFEARQAEENQRIEEEQAENVRRQIESLRREQATNQKREKVSKANAPTEYTQE